MKARRDGGRARGTQPTHPPPERALLVGVALKGQAVSWSLEASLEELGRLAETAGAQVVETVGQNGDKPTPTYLGSGKLQEVRDLVEELDCTIVLFNDELSPAQQRNLESALKVKIIDRTALILDIFGNHARTREGRLQVELAQHQYLLPRLAGQWSHLERLGGGIGTRGPGESQLETDRRLARDRIHRLEQELEAVRRHRALYRANRRRSGIPVVSLVGYTNAGKSTLMNALTQADVTVRDQVFATLDPVTRRLRLPSGLDLLLTDTVGFIQKLPPTLAAAFRVTLEELQVADILLHVVDAAHPNAGEQHETVKGILEGMGMQGKPWITVLNKIDLVAPSRDEAPDVVLGQEGLLGPLEGRDGGTVLVSAARGWGLNALLGALTVEVERLKGTLI